MITLYITLIILLYNFTFSITLQIIIIIIVKKSLQYWNNNTSIIHHSWDCIRDWIRDSAMVTHPCKVRFISKRYLWPYCYLYLYFLCHVINTSLLAIYNLRNNTRNSMSHITRNDFYFFLSFPSVRIVHSFLVNYNRQIFISRFPLLKNLVIKIGKEESETLIMIIL